MADKLKISKAAAERLNFLSTRLNLKRNVICRIAISISLAEETPVTTSLETDTEGYEFNKSTLYGPDELIFRSIGSYVQGEPAGPDFFNIVIRNHLERGLELMEARYEAVNSPVGYLSHFVIDFTEEPEMKRLKDTRQSKLL